MIEGTLRRVLNRILRRGKPGMTAGAAVMIACLTALASDSLAVTFTDIAAGLPTAALSSAAWGDCDNDGDLDLVIGGSPSTPILRVYRNDAGAFIDIGAGLPGISSSGPPTSHYVAWGDYDNDGDLDLAIAGLDATSTAISRIYRNDAGSFVDVAAGLPGASSASVAWGDYDNDGDLDLALEGTNTSGAIARVYRNDVGAFVDIAAGLTGNTGGTVAWGNFDGDADLDLIVVGTSASTVYRNDGGTFVDVAAGLPSLIAGSAAWGDYDNDGDLDLAVTGQNANRISRVYRNDSATFVDIGAALTGIFQGAASWGDGDGDGDLDLVITGFDAAFTRVSRLYRNDGGGTFVDTGTPLTGNAQGTVAWGDFDNDGRLDLLLTGTSASLIYRNDDASPNTAPAAPTNLATVRSGNQVTYSWTAAVDAQTPSSGLSYNLRVGTTPGGNEICAAMANSASGRRRVAQIGNAEERTSWTLDVPAGTYYWSVQAVDPTFAGSAFAAEAIEEPYFSDIGAGLASANIASAAWGDYDSDGDLDLVVTGSGNSRLYRNDTGTFSEIGAGLQGVALGSVAWGDYDGDGDLDLLIAGNTGSGLICRIYRNDSGSLNDIGAGLPGVSSGGPPASSFVAWGDYDNDGDLDLLLTGLDATSTRIARIYRDDSGTFVDIAAGLPGISSNSVAWGDYDNDGDLDIVMKGTTNTSTICRIYRNDAGAFVDIGAGLAGALAGLVSWGDYDGDGDLDLLLAGFETRVYRNDGAAFVDIAAGLPASGPGCAAWGDYDNDGDLDILIAMPFTASRLYRDDGGTFVDSGAAFPATGPGSSVAWGDYDNDGRLDFVLSGAPCVIEHNNLALPNTVPTAPTSLGATRSGNQVTFNWTASTDAQTPASGLSYNLRIGTTPGGNQIEPVMAGNATGFRRVVQNGNSQKRTTWTVKLPLLDYYWSVQAIDGAFAGSPFAAEKFFDARTSVDDGRGATPFALHPGVPNPFGRATTLAYDLSRTGRVRLEVFDLGGRRVRALMSTEMAAGRHQSVWDGTDDTGHRLPAGLYLARLEAGSFQATGRLLLLP